jgi:hypothetical protein
MKLEPTKKLKNELCTIVTSLGLDHTRFKWGEIASNFNTHSEWDDTLGGYHEVPEMAECLGMDIDGETYFFSVDKQHGGNYCSSMRPAIEAGANVKTDSFSTFKIYFSEWVSLVKYEFEEPDYWSLPFLERGSFTDSDFSDETKFTVTERAEIILAIDDIKQQLKALTNFGEERSKHVDQNFDYLKRKLETMSKFDWKNNALGILLHIAAASWLAPYADNFKVIISREAGIYLLKAIGWARESLLK